MMSNWALIASTAASERAQVLGLDALERARERGEAGRDPLQAAADHDQRRDEHEHDDDDQEHGEDDEGGHASAAPNPSVRAFM